MGFDGQHVIITGGSSGIGKATALLLAREGANISIMARGQDRLDAAKAEIEAARARPDQKVIALAADVADNVQVDRVIQTAVAQIGPPDILIASAGMAHPGYFMDVPLEVFERIMAVDYFGTLYAVRAVVPAMLARRKGHLVLISSGAGLMGFYGYASYSPAKFAVRGLAEVLRAELKEYGIKVSVVYPPDTDTPQLHEENKIKPAETRAVTGTSKMLSAEAVARSIVQGIQKGSFFISPGMDMTLLTRLHSLAAPALFRYFDGLADKGRKSKG